MALKTISTLLNLSRY